MAEPWLEQVASALKTRFESIVSDSGSTYWYKPDVVELTHTWESDPLLNPKYTTIYAFSPFEVEVEEAASHEIVMTSVIDFMLARRFERTDEPFKAMTPRRWTEQNRLFNDMLRKLVETASGGVTLGGLASNVDVRNVTLAAIDTHRVNWVLVLGQLAPTHKLETLALA